MHIFIRIYIHMCVYIYIDTHTCDVRLYTIYATCGFQLDKPPTRRIHKYESTARELDTEMPLVCLVYLTYNL